MYPYADEDDDGKTLTYEGYNYIRCPLCCNVVKLVKPDDKDADEENDGKALADEGYSYIRELEYQDGLEETDEEKDDEEAQPAKKPVKLGDEDSDEEAPAARPGAFVDGIPFYIRGRPVHPNSWEQSFYTPEELQARSAQLQWGEKSEIGTSARQCFFIFRRRREHSRG